jgi:hypothetical protein
MAGMGEVSSAGVSKGDKPSPLYSFLAIAFLFRSSFNFSVLVLKMLALTQASL